MKLSVLTILSFLLAPRITREKVPPSFGNANEDDQTSG
jgi:hypothetical protein